MLASEVFLAAVGAPALLVHWTKHTFVPVESSRRYVRAFVGPIRLMELDGAQHGCAVREDLQYQHPQTQAWQAEVIECVTAFLAGAPL